MKFYTANKKEDIDVWVLIFKKVPWQMEWKKTKEQYMDYDLVHM